MRRRRIRSGAASRSDGTESRAATEDTRHFDVRQSPGHRLQHRMKSTVLAFLSAVALAAAAWAADGAIIESVVLTDSDAIRWEVLPRAFSRSPLKGRAHEYTQMATNAAPIHAC